MSIPLAINGITYNYPEVNDKNWGAEATDWASAVTTGMLQKAGGVFQLLAETDFGTNYGLKSLYYKSRTSNVADSGQFRLARADVINWRNQANDGNLSLGVSASNILQFNGVSIQNSLSVSDTSTIDLTLSSDTLSADIVSGSITNSLISASAAIAFSKLASLTSANILVGSGSNVATSVAMSGDITISNTGVTAIGASKVVNAMLANMAESTFKGRAASSGTGAPVDLSATQATAILNAFVGDAGSGGTKGLVPAPQAGDTLAGKFLFADGTWTTPPGAGDVVGPASSTDNGFARFDGTDGKLLKDSPATVTNSDVAAAAGIAVNKLAALTASRAVVTDGSGFITQATTTATEIGYVNGVTSAIQTQLNGKLPTTITTTGDLIYSSSGTTASRLGIGSSGQGLKVVSGLPAWGFQAYRSVTTTDSPSNADDILVCSGNSFTMTLPTAVGFAGKIFTIIHNGTSLSQVYTLATTSAQTIGGVASGSYALYTNAERLRIVSDGANWIILEHEAITPWASYTPTVTALGTVADVSYMWKRSSDTLYVKGKMTNGTDTAAVPTISLPGSMAMDFNKLPPNLTTSLGFWYGNITTNADALPAATAGPWNVTYYSTQSSTAVIIVQRVDLNQTVSGSLFEVQNANAFTTDVGGDPMTIEFSCPISGWQP